MKTVTLALKQARFDNRAFWRNPAAAFFTFVFPLMFLVIFNVVFQSNDIEVPGGTVDTSTFYVPGITALSVISACYTNIAMGIVFSRDEGLLKRVRGTPLPPLSFILGRIIQATWVAILLVVIILAFGVVFYSVDVQSEKLPAFIVTLVFGAVCFSALGLAVSSLVPNADAAPAIIQASVLPLLFISNVFIPTSQAPGWLTDFASIFPVAHFAGALHTAFNPFESGNGFEAMDLLVMAIWGVGAAVVAARFFVWEPKR
ncbi:MAG TPA: ABC transporter permease [Dehalococcoidia bacterium]|nr:ABC transporter permease [Dehalococcoidia bacterium]